MDFANALEDHVPVGATKVRRCSQTSDSILFSVGIVNHDVGCVISLDLGRQILEERVLAKTQRKTEFNKMAYRVNLNGVIHILSLDS